MSGSTFKVQRTGSRIQTNTNAFNFDALLAPYLNPLPSGERVGRGGFHRNVTIINAFAIIINLEP
jgi:hypothetical protein